MHNKSTLCGLCGMCKWVLNSTNETQLQIIHFAINFLPQYFKKFKTVAKHKTKNIKLPQAARSTWC